MSSDRRFEQDLPGLLEDLYLGPMPTYRDHVLHRTARTRQRPAWSIPARWLPMVDITRQTVLAPRLPWRTVGLVLLLIALLAAMVAALAVGARPHLPEPFGRARTGLIAYASGGDIYTVDPSTGASTAVVTGPETDLNPRWSRDGTRLAFERMTAAGMAVFVARRDGSGLVRVTPDPLYSVNDLAFSPDGKQLLISAEVTAGTNRAVIAATDGSQVHELDASTSTTYAAWRPPNGSEILYMDGLTDGSGNLLAVNPSTGTVRTILADSRATGRNRGHPTWSPDGSLISYGEWDINATDLTVQTHVMAADGSGNRILPMPAGAKWQAPFSWSNDGTRLLVIRGYSGGSDQSRLAVVPVDGSGTGVEIQYPGTIDAAGVPSAEWAPDDSSILVTPVDGSGAALDQVLLDPVAGTSRTLPWSSTSLPSWQRLAP